MARVPYVTPSSLDPAHRELVVSSLQPGKRLNVYSAMANNVAVLEGLAGFLDALWSASGLTDRERELVVLTVAAEVGSTYEWHHHATIGSNAGLAADEIAAIGRGDQAPFSTRERLLGAYARAVARGRVEDPVHDAVAEHYDTEAVVGAAMVAAGYVAVALAIDALGVELEDDESFRGWE